MSDGTLLALGAVTALAGGAVLASRRGSRIEADLSIAPTVEEIQEHVEALEAFRRPQIDPGSDRRDQFMFDIRHFGGEMPRALARILREVHREPFGEEPQPATALEVLVEGLREHHPWVSANWMTAGARGEWLVFIDKDSILDGLIGWATMKRPIRTLVGWAPDPRMLPRLHEALADARARVVELADLRKRIERGVRDWDRGRNAHGALDRANEAWRSRMIHRWPR